MEEIVELELEPGTLVKKGKFGWRLIHPWKNKEGKINWFNFLTGGSWANLIKVILVVCFLVGLVFAYKHDVATLTDCCQSACKSLIRSTGPITELPTMNLTLP